MLGSRRLALAGLLVAAISAPSMAQGPGGGRGGMGGGGMAGPGLVAMPAVQKELKLDAAQVDKAADFAERQREKMQEMRSELQGLQGAEMNEKRMELTRKMNESGMKEVAAFLKPEQEKRLKQIVVQQQGLQAFASPEVAKELKITDEQKTKVRTLMSDMQGDVRDAMQDAGDDRQAANAKVAKIRKETMSKAMGLMTDEQKKMYKEMTGEPFEMPAMMGGGRGGRGGNNN